MSIPWSNSNVATVSFTNLPLSEKTTGLQVVAVQDNVSTVRVSWDALASQFLHIATTLPGSPASQGDTMECWIHEDGFYTWDDGMWGKSPRMQAHWDDTVKSDDGAYVRFLIVHKDQELTDTEKEQALKNIGLTVASSTLGLVREPDSVVDKAPVHIDTTGAMTVPQATSGTYGSTRLLRYTPAPVGEVPQVDDSAIGNDVVPYQYFSDMWAALPLYSLPPATYTSLGGIVPYTADFDMDPEPDNPDETLLPGTMRARKASYTQYGYVKKLDVAEWYSWYTGNEDYKSLHAIDTTAVPEYSLVHALAETLKVFPAEEGSYGTVKLSAMVQKDDDGKLYVRSATQTNSGVVKTIGSFSTWRDIEVGDQDIVPSVYAVGDYVNRAMEKAFAGFSASQDPTGDWVLSIPHASRQTAGIVRLSEQFSVAQIRDGASTYTALYPVKASPDVDVTSGNVLSIRSGTVFVNPSYSTVYSLPTASDYNCLVPSYSSMVFGDSALEIRIAALENEVATLKSWQETAVAAIADLEQRVSALEGNEQSPQS